MWFLVLTPTNCNLTSEGVEKRQRQGGRRERGREKHTDRKQTDEGRDRERQKERKATGQERREGWIRLPNSPQWIKGDFNSSPSEPAPGLPMLSVGRVVQVREGRREGTDKKRENGTEKDGVLSLGVGWVLKRNSGYNTRSWMRLRVKQRKIGRKVYKKRRNVYPLQAFLLICRFLYDTFDHAWVKYRILCSGTLVHFTKEYTLKLLSGKFLIACQA